MRTSHLSLSIVKGIRGHVYRGSLGMHLTKWESLWCLTIIYSVVLLSVNYCLFQWRFAIVQAIQVLKYFSEGMLYTLIEATVCETVSKVCSNKAKL